MESDIAWAAISDQMNREAEYQGTLLEILTEIRTQINEAFDVLDDEDGLTEEASAMIWASLDTMHDEISFVIGELTQD